MGFFQTSQQVRRQVSTSAPYTNVAFDPDFRFVPESPPYEQEDKNPLPPYTEAVVVKEQCPGDAEESQSDDIQQNTNNSPAGSSSMEEVTVEVNVNDDDTAMEINVNPPNDRDTVLPIQSESLTTIPDQPPPAYSSLSENNVNVSGADDIGEAVGTSQQTDTDNVEVAGDTLEEVEIGTDNGNLTKLWHGITWCTNNI